MLPQSRQSFVPLRRRRNDLPSRSPFIPLPPPQQRRKRPRGSRYHHHHHPTGTAVPPPMIVVTSRRTTRRQQYQQQQLLVLVLWRLLRWWWWFLLHTTTTTGSNHCCDDMDAPIVMPMMMPIRRVTAWTPSVSFLPHYHPPRLRSSSLSFVRPQCTTTTTTTTTTISIATIRRRLWLRQQSENDSEAPTDDNNNNNNTTKRTRPNRRPNNNKNSSSSNNNSNNNNISSSNNMASTYPNNRRNPNNNNNSSRLPSPPPKASSPRRPAATAPPTTTTTFTSLLPPPIPNNNRPISTSSSSSSSSNRLGSDDDDDDEDFVTHGLTSWDEFLGRGRRATSDNNNNNDEPRATDASILARVLDQLSTLSPSSSLSSSSSSSSVLPPPVLPQQQPQLPSIQDLFPSDLTVPPVAGRRTTTTTKTRIPTADEDDNDDVISNAQQRRSDRNVLEGVLPVSDLFYRSTSDQDGDDDDEHDDEELPFSAEQSDSLTSEANQVRVRQNRRTVMEERMVVDRTNNNNNNRVRSLTNNSNDDDNNNNMTRSTVDRMVDDDYDIGDDSGTSSNQGRSGLKMIRRGMEMLVGGVPIFADPPQRSIQITYQPPPPLRGAGYDWASTISCNTRDFGPLLHTESIPKVSDYERGLFCEFFCHSAIKWDVCPKDLRQIVNNHRATTIKLAKESSVQSERNQAMAPDSEIGAKSERKTKAVYVGNLAWDVTWPDLKAHVQEAGFAVNFGNVKTSQNGRSRGSGMIGFHTVEDAQKAMLALNNTEFRGRPMFVREYHEKHRSSGSDSEREVVGEIYGSTTVDAVGKSQDALSNAEEEDRGISTDDGLVRTSGEIRFEIGVTRDELEMGSGRGKGSEIFQAVFLKAFNSILDRAINASTTKRLWENVTIDVPTLTLQETDDGYTSVCAEFRIDANMTSTDADRELRLSKIGSAFSRSMDDGGFALAIAAAAKDETRWPKTVRNRVVEECLFQDDDGDESAERIHWTRTESPVMYDQEVGLVLPARIGDGRRSLYKGGGTDGVFHDFSAMNALNAPYSGEIGLRLVDAVTEQAKQRHPKVIAIGDVHGCIDELQDLLRQCDFRPGDLVVFLGDLVCKGPDSIAVVQMAREIGAIGVRGNHDFEVVRWQQAIISGVDPPVFGSEHYQIASCLSKADMNWMHSLPWYISCKSLSALFVHAGFVSGIRLAKQNPRLMMNMRSILPDGTVTSKFFNNWPWARLWDGPQTVLFGHDADRGLQQYEHAIGLDTGCVYGGRLTACILPEKKLVSVSAKRAYFKYRRKHYD